MYRRIIDEMIRKKKYYTLIAIIVSVFIVGCDNRNDYSIQSLSVISLSADEAIGETHDASSEISQSINDNYDLLTIEIDSDNQLFTIRCIETGEDLSFKGLLLTYNCPDRANIYKIIRFDEDPESFYNPIKEWQRVWFQSAALLMGNPEYRNDMSGYDQLSRSERISIINSTTRLNTMDLSQMNIIKSAFPEDDFCDYVLKSTFPPVETTIYEIFTYDTRLNKTLIADRIINRSFDYYVVRRSINGITVGLPSSIYVHYVNYDALDRIETSIYSDSYSMYYDNKDVYEVHSNNRVNTSTLELYSENRPILSFEDAMIKATPAIYQYISDAETNNKEIYIYAVELVYLTIQKSDMSDVDYYHDETIYYNSYEEFLYPFWAIYVHNNYICAGEDLADHQPLLVNAITGEVVLCN